MRRFLLMVVGALAVVSALVLPAGAQTACTDTASPSTVVVKSEAAPTGAVVCLAAGSYGQRSFTAKRSGTVTLRPADGAVVSINPTVYGSGYRFDGLTITGLYTNGARNTAFVNSKFTGSARIDVPPSAPNAGIVFDHDTFDGITACGQCFEGRLTVVGTNGTYTAPVGVTITNSHFGGGGGSDGVQITGDAYGVRIVGNEFTGIRQGSYAAHVDPIQLYGSSHTLIADNYFHDNSTGIMAPNGGESETFSGNVFVMDEYPYAAYFGWVQGLTVTHNTIVGGSLHFEDWTNGTDHPPAHTSGVVRDNVLAGGLDKIKIPAGLAQDYNLLPSGASGAHDVTGTPRFQGGAGIAAYQLAALSPGAGAASDGTDMGVYVAGAPTPTPTPTPTDTPTPSPTASPTPSPEPTPTPEPAYHPACEPTCDDQIAALAADMAAHILERDQATADRDEARAERDALAAKIAAASDALR